MISYKSAEDNFLARFKLVITSKMIWGCLGLVNVSKQILWPEGRGDGVILSPPCSAVVDGLPIDLQPLAHLSQTLLKDGGNASIMGGSHIHQQIPATRYSLH